MCPTGEKSGLLRSRVVCPQRRRETELQANSTFVQVLPTKDRCSLCAEVIGVSTTRLTPLEWVLEKRGRITSICWRSTTRFAISGASIRRSGSSGDGSGRLRSRLGFERDHFPVKSTVRRFLMRGTFFTLLWGAVFFFGSVFLQLFVFAEYFRVPLLPGEGALYAWAQWWKYVHMGVGGLGLLLGILGLLPGTRRPKPN